MKSEKKSFASSMGLLAVSLALWLPTAAWLGFVVSKLWGWFIVPLGAPSIGIWHACGIAIICWIPNIGIAMRVGKNETHEELFTYAIGGCFGLLFFLGFGYIYHLFM